ncbi:MAG TPA: hypothetical protein VN153_12770 [Tahibacter sp.]|nr:hypothetical protein [Tahibacter sp.]
MRSVFAALFLFAAADVATACPPALSSAQLQAIESTEDASTYVLLRWLKCGPADAAVLWPTLRDAVRRKQAEEEAIDAGPNADAEADVVVEAEPDPAALMLLFALSMNPDALVRSLDDGHSGDEPVLDALMRWPVPAETMKRHFEQGIAPALALLRQEPMTPALEWQAEFVRVAQEVRQGRITEARAHVARLVAAPPPAGVEDSVGDWTKEMVELLAEPAQRSTAAGAPGWVLDRSTATGSRRRCGTAEVMHELGPAYLRGIVLRAAEPDAAIADQLEKSWRTNLRGDIRKADLALLAELLRKRYGAAELRQGWDDAVAMIRNDEQVAGTQLLGHFLVLPSDVIEDDKSAPGGTRQRKLSTAELAELVRASPLYRATYGGG